MYHFSLSLMPSGISEKVQTSGQKAYDFSALIWNPCLVFRLCFPLHFHTNLPLNSFLIKISFLIRPQQQLETFLATNKKESTKVGRLQSRHAEDHVQDVLKYGIIQGQKGQSTAIEQHFPADTSIYNSHQKHVKHNCAWWCRIRHALWLEGGGRRQWFRENALSWKWCGMNQLRLNQVVMRGGRYWHVVTGWPKERRQVEAGEGLCKGNIKAPRIGTA